MELLLKKVALEKFIWLEKDCLMMLILFCTGIQMMLILQIQEHQILTNQQNLLLADNRIKKAQVPFFVKPITKAIANKVLSEFVNPNIQRLLEFIEGSLEGKKWFLGNQLSCADILMSFPLETSVTRGLIDEDYPCIKSYVNRIQQLPAYQSALKKGGKYDYA